MPVTYGTKQIAAMVRKQIASEVKAGHLPAGKYSVRIDETSTSASINVVISGPTWSVSGAPSSCLRFLRAVGAL